MARLDEAAEMLLDRYFKMPSLDTMKDGEKSPEGADQIKAFDAVVKYFGPRTKLGGDEDNKESAFDQLRSGLHGRRTPRGGARRTTPNGSGNGAADTDPASGAA